MTEPTQTQRCNPAQLNPDPANPAQPGRTVIDNCGGQTLLTDNGSQLKTLLTQTANESRTDSQTKATRTDSPAQWPVTQLANDSDPMTAGQTDSNRQTVDEK